MDEAPVYEWWVSFNEPGPDPVVRAASKDEAYILAQARRIQGGYGWREVKGAVQVPARHRVHKNSLS